MIHETLEQTLDRTLCHPIFCLQRQPTVLTQSSETNTRPGQVRGTCFSFCNTWWVSHSQSKGDGFVLHGNKSNSLELLSQVAFRAHISFYSSHAPILLLAISPSLTSLFLLQMAMLVLYLSSPCDFTDMCTSHALSFRE